MAYDTPKVAGNRTENDTVVETTQKALSIETISLVNDIKVLSVPAGRQVTSIKPYIDEYRTAPERRKGTATFTDIESFVAHANRFRDEDSVIFADDNRDHPSLTSILDYHCHGSTGAPRFGQHRGAYTFPLSDEWEAWTAQDAKEMNQTDFARFVEDHNGDVAMPDSAAGSAADWAARLGTSFASPSRIIELSRGLQVHVKSAVRESRNLASGEGQVFFASENLDMNGAALNVPAAFLLAIPIFRRGDVFPVPARLRYRVRDGKITWWFELARAEQAFEVALGDALKLVAEKTQLPVLRGSPE
jgi:uncharacterized protein YfdQ (DUF2303 family)